MTDDQLTEELARQVLGWKVAPGRFVKSGRSWIPKWRFNPLERLEDAFRLLEEAAPHEYSICGDDKGNCWAHLRLGKSTGDAIGASKARVISIAIARALGIELVPDQTRSGDAC